MTGHLLHASVLALTCVIGLASTAPARTVFDGSWSVVIYTRSGACVRAYRSGVQIRNGIISSDAVGFNMNGSVSAKGTARASVSAGGQSANGSGRLSRNSGGGVWRGQGNAGQCSGTWTADALGSLVTVLDGGLLGLRELSCLQGAPVLLSTRQARAARIRQSAKYLFSRAN
jgi:hypothetical protein